MAIDLSPRFDDFAVYLPAFQFGFTSAVDSDKKRDKKRAFPNGLKLTDLDFLNPKSKLWFYKYGLYSAGQFESIAPRACSVTNRDRLKTLIVGDSGGFQIGKGTLKELSHFKNAKTGNDVCDLWRDSVGVRTRIVQWLDLHSDYAMTIDMPLWAKLESNKNTPFHKCSVEQLIKLSVENLDFINNNSNGKTKWLSVLQGTNEKDSKQWWDAVKKYRFSGWALAGSVGWRGSENVEGLQSVLYNVMQMRDDDAFAIGQEWMHVLGVSQPTWAVLFTAIQRGIRRHCNNPNFRVSYDSASAFQASGRYQKVVRYPKFSKDLKSWTMSLQNAPVNPLYGSADKEYHFPFSSPLGEQMTLEHLNVNGSTFEGVPYDSVAGHMLTNHNTYVYVRSFLEANELAYMLRSESQYFVPQSLIDTCAFIENLLGESNWKKKLEKEKILLSSVFN